MSATRTTPMDDVHQRARRGIRVLLGRQALLHLLAITGGIFVARLLGPGPIGVFGIALFVVDVLALLADLGMRTALIQQASPPTPRQLRTYFTIQQALTTVLVASVYMVAPAVASVYPEAPELTSLIRLLALDLYLRSWRAMSEVRLEREVRYGELALADLVASVMYHAVAVGLVLAGAGAYTLVVATLLGGVVRTLVLRRTAPWPVRLGFDGVAARQLLSAGIPMQMNEIVGRAPAWITPTLVGVMLGPHAVGLLTWAVMVGHKPLEMLHNVIRVSLTHFARLQHDITEVASLLARYAIGSLLVCGLWFAVLAAAGHELVALLYTERWLPAMPALLVFAASAMLVAVRRLAVIALIGIGRARVAARVSAVAALASIVVSVMLVFHIGFLGVPIGHAVGVALSMPWLLRALHPATLAGLLSQAFKTVIAPITAAALAGVAVSPIAVPPAARGLITTAVVSTVFAAVAWWTAPRWLRTLLREELTAPSLRLRKSAVPRP